jgi:hypothetical protein
MAAPVSTAAATPTARRELLGRVGLHEVAGAVDIEGDETAVRALFNPRRDEG